MAYVFDVARSRLCQIEHRFAQIKIIWNNLYAYILTFPYLVSVLKKTRCNFVHVLRSESVGTETFPRRYVVAITFHGIGPRQYGHDAVTCWATDITRSCAHVTPTIPSPRMYILRNFEQNHLCDTPRLAMEIILFRWKMEWNWRVE